MALEFDVVDLGETAHPEEGETAPDFVRPLVTDEYWEDAALSALVAERPVLLVFHPMAGAFPATYIWKELREREFDQYDVSLVGCSISTPYEHKRFIRDRDLTELGARLFSDPANGVGEQYGIAHDLDGMAGVTEHRPAAFLIDTDRTIQYAWVAQEWPEFPAYDDLEDALSALTESST